MKKWIFLMVLCLCYLPVYAGSVSRDLSGELLRLHIKANSDSVIDQQIKLEVRNRILAQARDTLQGQKKEDFCKNLKTHLPEWTAIADGVLAENGCDYRASASIGTVYIPRKAYQNIMMPEGHYESLVLTLGAGAGENWWCVVYPPLCFTEETVGDLSEEGKKILREKLSEESYQLISKDGVMVEYRFKIVELVQKLLHQR